MSRARHPVMFASLALAGAVLAVGCKSIIGADGDYRDVVNDLCFCIEEPMDMPDCRSDVGSRLANATPDVVDAWLSNYSDNCLTCDEASSCYYVDPTCSHADCSRDNECCSRVCKDNVCVEP